MFQSVGGEHVFEIGVRVNASAAVTIDDAVDDRTPIAGFLRCR